MRSPASSPTCAGDFTGVAAPIKNRSSQESDPGHKARDKSGVASRDNSGMVEAKRSSIAAGEKARQGEAMIRWLVAAIWLSAVAAPVLAADPTEIGIGYLGRAGIKPKLSLVEQP